MKPYHTLLVGAALNDRDSATLAHAAWFARAMGSRLVYFAHVVPTFDMPDGMAEKDHDAFKPRDEEIEAKLNDLLGRTPNLFATGTTVRPTVRQGSLVPELLRLASQKSADLLVLGRPSSDGSHPLSQAAHQLVRQSPCSVFTVPSNSELVCRRILVPVDFSDRSHESINTACTLARAVPNTSVVVQNTYEVPMGWHKTVHSYEDFAALMKQNAERHWKKFTSTADFTGVNVEARFDLGDDVPGTILRVAEEIDASLVVMGSHGRTLPAEFLLGHVADKVCARTSRPVLCVKRKGEVVNLLHALLQIFNFEDK